MRHTVYCLALATVAAAAPLAAQGGGMAGMPGMRGGGDPTMAIQGSGKLPDGWMMRFDPTRGNAPTPAMTAISFVTMAGGYHVKSGPAAIYYNPKDMGHGQFAVTATFKQSKSMVHEAFGIFVGGKNLQDSAQTYLYFVIKPADGSMLIAHRTQFAGSPRPTVLVPETPATPEAAINRDAPADGSATNTLLIHVAKDTVHFSINGKLVKAIAKSDLGMSIDGQAGLRINHNMDLHIDGWKVTQY